MIELLASWTCRCSATNAATDAKPCRVWRFNPARVKYTETLSRRASLQLLSLERCVPGTAAYRCNMYRLCHGLWFWKVRSIDGGKRGAPASPQRKGRGSTGNHYSPVVFVSPWQPLLTFPSNFNPWLRRCRLSSDALRRGAVSDRPLSSKASLSLSRHKQQVFS